MKTITKAELIAAAARAGFGANQRNTLLVKLILFAKHLGVAVEDSTVKTYDTARVELNGTYTREDLKKILDALAEQDHVLAHSMETLCQPTPS